MAQPDVPVISYETFIEAEDNRKMTRLGTVLLENAMWQVCQADHQVAAPWRDPNRAQAFRVLDACRVLASLDERR
jgi:hypothetical protein